MQRILQILIPPPYYFDHKSKRAIENPLYSKTIYKYFRIFSQTAIHFLLLPLMLHRLAYCLIYWNSYATVNIEQLILYGISTCLMLVYLPVYILFRNDSNTFSHAMNMAFYIQSLNLCEIKPLLKFRIPGIGTKSIEEICIYFFSFAFLLIPPACFMAPFILSYLPMQLIFGQSLLVKILSSIILFCASAYGSLSVLSLLLLSVTYLEVVLAYSGLIYCKECTKCDVNLAQHFGQCCKRFRSTQLLVSLGNILCGPFGQNLIFIGVSLATCSSYITFKYESNDMMGYVMYSIGPGLTLICFALALILTYLASIPYKNSQQFRTFWSFHVKQKVHKRLLRSCKPFGFELGPYGTVNATLGIRICDDIINNVVNAFLLDSA